MTTVNRKILDNGNVEMTIIREIPRYKGEVSCDNIMCQDIFLTEVKQNGVLIYPFECGTFDAFQTWDVDEEELNGNTMSVAKQILQTKLDEQYGKDTYKVFVLGVYEHSSVAFHIVDSDISQSGCPDARWDGRNSGFVAVPNDENQPWNSKNVDKLSRLLTSLYNGEVYEYMIVDNSLDDDDPDNVVDSCWFIDGIDDTACKDFRKNALEKYNVDFEKVEVRYF